jgi:hypothetical protein
MNHIKITVKQNEVKLNLNTHNKTNHLKSLILSGCEKNEFGICCSVPAARDFTSLNRLSHLNFSDPELF